MVPYKYGVPSFIGSVIDNHDHHERSSWTLPIQQKRPDPESFAQGRVDFEVFPFDLLEHINFFESYELDLHFFVLTRTRPSCSLESSIVKSGEV